MCFYRFVRPVFIIHWLVLNSLLTNVCCRLLCVVAAALQAAYITVLAVVGHCRPVVLQPQQMPVQVCPVAS